MSRVGIIRPRGSRASGSTPTQRGEVAVGRGDVGHLGVVDDRAVFEIGSGSTRFVPVGR